MAGQSVGSCPCSVPDCSEVAEVRQMRSKAKGAAGVLYLFCNSCGMVTSSGIRFQNYIEKNADFDEPDVVPFIDEQLEVKKDKVEVKKDETFGDWF